MLELSYMDDPARHAFETAKQAVSLMRKGHGLLCQDMKQVIKLEVGDSGAVASKSNQQVLTIVMLNFAGRVSRLFYEADNLLNQHSIQCKFFCL